MLPRKLLSATFNATQTTGFPPQTQTGDRSLTRQDSSSPLFGGVTQQEVKMLLL